MTTGSQSNRRGALIALSVVLIIAIGVAIFSFLSMQNANNERDRANLERNQANDNAATNVAQANQAYTNEANAIAEKETSQSDANIASTNEALAVHNQETSVAIQATTEYRAGIAQSLYLSNAAIAADRSGNS